MGVKQQIIRLRRSLRNEPCGVETCTRECRGVSYWCGLHTDACLVNSPLYTGLRAYERLQESKVTGEKVFRLYMEVDDQLRREAKE